MHPYVMCSPSADFGLSWKLQGAKQHVSHAYQGTAFYIAPEVLHAGIMSKAADAFSFGMLLHEVCVCVCVCTRAYAVCVCTCTRG